MKIMHLVIPWQDMVLNFRRAKDIISFVMWQCNFTKEATQIPGLIPE